LRAFRRVPHLTLLSVLFLPACSDPDTNNKPEPSAGAGGAAQGGASTATQQGGKTTSTAGGKNSSGGAFSSGGNTGSSSGGYSSGGYVMSNAGFPAMVPPPAASDGSSPYVKECHGDTRSCVDVANLRCLGIRDDSGIHGYSCSNPCDNDADCSLSPTQVAATAACVDFVTQKHCLLVCQQGDVKRGCPSGMNCYVYPGTTLGYCLWP